MTHRILVILRAHDGLHQSAIFHRLGLRDDQWREFIRALHTVRDAGALTITDMYMVWAADVAATVPDVYVQLDMFSAPVGAERE